MSQSEQNIIATMQTAGGEESWAGGTYSAANDGWIWVDGPDVGVKFNKKDRYTTAGSGVVPGIFSNFSAVQPDGDVGVNGGLHIVHNYNGINSAPSNTNGWNDASTGIITGFFFEMGGLPSDANIITVDISVNNSIILGTPL